MRIKAESFAGKCSCGREHNIQVKEIYIESGASDRLCEMLADGELSRFESPVAVCDKNTEMAAKSLTDRLRDRCEIICLAPENLHADNVHVDILEKSIPQDCGLIIAVGSGTVHDLSRFVSYGRGIPFVSVPTAASVDGFVSTVAAMTWNGMKKTFPAQAPLYVFADTDIFSKAPYRLTASGVSDLLGKYTALADWKAAHLVTGEYICDRIVSLEEKAVKEVVDNIDAVRNGSAEICEKLMYALILSGLAMQMTGNSRPASGAEHHISHLIEMEVINGPVDALHGEKVSVGLMLCLDYYHRLSEDIRAGRAKAADYDGTDTERAKEVFAKKGLLDGFLQENTPDPLLTVDRERLENSLNALADIIDGLPTVDEMKIILNKGGCTAALEDIGMKSSDAEKLISLSPFVRNRLTINRLSNLIERNQP